MARRSNAETAAAARRAKVAALYLRGKSQQEIARAVRASQPTVSRDLAALRAEWQTASARASAARIAEELAKIDRMEAEAWEAWDRSRKPAKTTTAEKSGTRGGTTPAVRSKASTRVEGRDGDPRFMHVVEWCITRRCELLGLDAPTNTRTVLAGDPNAPLHHDHDFRGLSDAELDAQLAAARGRAAAAGAGAPGPPGGGAVPPAGGEGSGPAE